MTDEEIEAELARLALEGSGRGLQPKVAALRAILKNRQVKRARGGVHEDAETVGVFAELDLLPDMARAAGMAIGPDEWNAGMSLRVRGLERDGRAILKAPDRAVALAEWRKRQSAA